MRHHFPYFYLLVLILTWNFVTKAKILRIAFSFSDTFGWSLQWSWFHSLEGMLEHHRNNCGDLRTWRSSTSLEGQLHGRLEVRRRFKRRRTRLRVKKYRIQYIFSTDEIFSPIKYIDIKNIFFPKKVQDNITLLLWQWQFFKPSFFRECWSLFRFEIPIVHLKIVAFFE